MTPKDFISMNEEDRADYLRIRSARVKAQRENAIACVKLLEPETEEAKNARIAKRIAELSQEYQRIFGK